MCLVPHYVVFPCCPGSFFPAFSRPAPQQIMPSLEIGAASCLFLHLSLQHSVQPVVVEHLPLVGLSDTCAQNDARTVVSLNLALKLPALGPSTSARADVQDRHLDNSHVEHESAPQSACLFSDHADIHRLGC